MVDVVDKKTRSRMMSGIRGKDTKPEVLIRKALFARGFRYRLHARNLLHAPSDQVGHPGGGSVYAVVEHQDLRHDRPGAGLSAGSCLLRGCLRAGRRVGLREHSQDV